MALLAPTILVAAGAVLASTMLLTKLRMPLVRSQKAVVVQASDWSQHWVGPATAGTLCKDGFDGGAE